MILCVSGLGVAVGSRVENVVCALSVTVSLAAVCLLSDNHLFQIKPALPEPYRMHLAVLL